MSNKETDLKEKLRQALSSTIRVISDDLEIDKGKKNNSNSEKFSFLELDKLNSKSDFIRARAESDSAALKKKFSNTLIYKKNSPSNSSCKSLYAIAEKIRYETLGGRMLKGIKKNFKENYSQVIKLKNRDQLKSKEDVTIAEAFELYMLKNFHDIELSTLSSKILNFWEKDFDESINKHVKFLKDSVENQNMYGSRFSQILQEMDVFQTEDKEEAKEENQEENPNASSDDDEENNSDSEKEQNSEQESQASLDSDYNIDEHKIDEQLADSETDKKNSEQAIQKKKLII